jgi:hypothetical protein
VHQEQPRHYEWQGDGLAHAEALSQRAAKEPVSVAGKAAPSLLPAPVKVISAYASFDLEKAAIDALKRGWAQTPAAFADKKAEMLADAKKRWGIGKKGAAAAPRVVLAADEVAWTLIDLGVDKEWALFKEQREKCMLGSKKLVYGHPFAPCTLPDKTGKDVVCAASSARFAFWPANKTAMPLLYIAAIIFLCNCKATSTFNESFHSVWRRTFCATAGAP